MRGADHRSSSSEAVLVTGTVGVGKTTVAVEIGVLLSEADVPYAVLDLDWLAWCRPSPEAGAGTAYSSLLCENLRSMRVTYESVGIQRFVLAGAVTKLDDLAAVRDALGGMPVKVVLLDAPSSSIIERLAKRDIASKTIETDDDLHAFDERVRSAAVEGFTVQNVGDPRATASRVLAWAKWL